MRWLLLAPLLALVVLFALSNREPVLLRLWPLDLIWQAPLAVAVLVVGALTFLLGALMVWLSSLPHRRRARRADAEIRRLEGEVEAFRARDRANEAARLTAPGPEPASVVALPERARARS